MIDEHERKLAVERLKRKAPMIPQLAEKVKCVKLSDCCGTCSTDLQDCVAGCRLHANRMRPVSEDMSFQHFSQPLHMSLDGF